MSKEEQNIPPQDPLKELKEIILKEIQNDMLALRHQLDDENHIENRVSPFVKNQLEILKNNFPKEFNQEVNKIIDKKLEDSQDKIVDIIYPKLDLMIKKYVTHQFQKLKESIESRVNKIQTNLSLKSLMKRMQHNIYGISAGDEILVDLDKPKIEEIFLVQQPSGLLMGSATREKNMNQDVIAGMLTAIKAFVEDAMKTNAQLEMIQYENYNILLHNFQSYYFAVALTGSISADEKENLSEDLINFAQNEIPFHTNTISESSFKLLSERLHAKFLAYK